MILSGWACIIFEYFPAPTSVRRFPSVKALSRFEYGVHPPLPLPDSPFSFFVSHFFFFFVTCPSLKL